MRFHAAALGAAAAIFSGACTTVTTPVLRHQTGEALGVKHARVRAHVESSQVHAPSTTPETLGVEQKKNSFQGILVGIQGEGGVAPGVDLQLGTSVTSTGGGWRVGAKYQAIHRGRLAVAGMIGYGARSGSGTIEYQTTSTPIEIDQTLSGKTLDLSVPVSYLLNPTFTAYGGVMFLRTWLTGNFGTQVVSDTFLNPGINFGMKVTVGMFEGDLEIAWLSAHNPFTDSETVVPYVGGSLGVVF